jgi:peroxiredoxin Q/BCP
MNSTSPAVGEIAPDFTLTADDGTQVTLSQLRGKKVILYFYPKDDTSGCTTQACGFRDSYPLITEKNAVVLGVSPDGEASHRTFKTKYNLPFTLLVDDQHTVAQVYGIWAEKSMYGKTHWGIVRSHFVIDEEGRIAEAAVKVSPEDSVTSAVAALG